MNVLGFDFEFGDLSQGADTGVYQYQILMNVYQAGGSGRSRR
jgi:hypothetical protein